MKCLRLRKSSKLAWMKDSSCVRSNITRYCRGIKTLKKKLRTNKTLSVLNVSAFMPRVRLLDQDQTLESQFWDKARWLSQRWVSASQVLSQLVSRLIMNETFGFETRHYNWTILYAFRKYGLNKAYYSNKKLEYILMVSIKLWTFCTLILHIIFLVALRQKSFLS